MRTYVIADIGANHDGKPARMFEAVDAAKWAGASAIKFQWVSDPARMAARRRATADGYAEIYARYLAFPREFLEALAFYCHQAGIGFMCTTFLPEDVAVVAPLVARFKVASFEATDRNHLAAHAGYGTPVVVSCGMCSASDVGAIREAGQDYGLDLRLLHGVSSYPTPLDALNLSLIRPFKFDGLSDHAASESLLSGALAVAAGARILETHLRLQKTDAKNPDWSHALWPSAFQEYVDLVQKAEAALGDGRLDPRPDCEAAMAAYRVR